MLAFLLDEQIPHVVAEQLRQKRPDIEIESVLLWRDGNLRGKPDNQVLEAAHEAGLTLVTYDQKVIPPLLMELAANGGHHSGVVFVDRRGIASENIGALTQALIAFYDLYHALPWTGLVMFLAPAT
jgi:predicted nuclease of predicted toxin-antitoxin system